MVVTMNTKLRKAEIFHKDLGMFIVLYRSDPDGKIGDISVEHAWSDVNTMVRLSKDQVLVEEIEELVRQHYLKELDYERQQQKGTGRTGNTNALP
jgi:hypothetical protein